MVRDARLSGRVPRASSDTHDDQPRSAFSVLAEVLGAEGEDDGVADGFEEEEEEEGDDA